MEHMKNNVVLDIFISLQYKRRAATEVVTKSFCPSPGLLLYLHRLGFSL